MEVHNWWGKAIQLTNKALPYWHNFYLYEIWRLNQTQSISARAQTGLIQIRPCPDRLNPDLPVPSRQAQSRSARTLNIQLISVLTQLIEAIVILSHSAANHPREWTISIKQYLGPWLSSTGCLGAIHSRQPPKKMDDPEEGSRSCLWCAHNTQLTLGPQGETLNNPHPSVSFQ